MSTKEVGLYARVSSEQQAQAQTISSQLDALHELVGSRAGMTPRPSLLEPYVKVSLHTAPDCIHRD